MFTKQEYAKRLSPCALGVGVGVVKALAIAATALMLAMTDQNDSTLKHFFMFYSTPNVFSLWKVLLVMGQGLVLGFISGAVLAWVYNGCMRCCGCKPCSLDRQKNVTMP